jgi:tetratricopeptide (TPR) repeat protein
MRGGAIFLLAIGQLLPHSSAPSPLVYAREDSPNRSEQNATASTSEIDQMVHEYMTHVETLVELLHSDKHTQKSTDIITKGREAFNKALAAFPDETVVHAHALFAKICVKVGLYDEATNLFDEAIRRARLSLEVEQIDPSTRAETEGLVSQLYLERNRSHNQFIESKVLQWHTANDQIYKGGIPPETSPWHPLSYVELQLGIFPLPNPQTLFEKATLITLTLDSPDEEIQEMKSGDEKALNATARAWEAYESYQKSQSLAFGAYTHGKKRHLAGGQPCRDGGYGLVVGGTAWSKSAWKSNPFSYDKTKDAGQSDDLYMGIITFQNVLISGRDAVISGYGNNCNVFARHAYVNLPNNIPLVTAWETPIFDTTIEDNPMWTTYIPEGDTSAFGGSVGKDNNGNDALLISDPRSNNAVFDSVILLSGYASENYFHFITEVLPSLVVMRNRIKDIINQERTEANDVVVVPNLQYEFVEGFLRLLLPEAFDDEGKLSPHIVQWGPWKKPGMENGGANYFTSTHPIAYTKRLATVMWDQPKKAPSPLSGPAHCLTPKPLIRAIQRVVFKSVDSPASHLPKRIVYCSRSSSATRKLAEEDELMSRLRQIASKEGAELIVFEKQATTDATAPSPLAAVKDAIQLFQSATVVVGVHGASLANIAFSRKGTTVIEIGFGIPQAGHYLHLAESLELKYVGIRLKQNSRSFGAIEVSLPEGGVDEIANAVVEGLERAERRDGGDEL